MTPSILFSLSLFEPPPPPPPPGLVGWCGNIIIFGTCPVRYLAAPLPFLPQSISEMTQRSWARSGLLLTLLPKGTVTRVRNFYCGRSKSIFEKSARKGRLVYINILLTFFPGAPPRRLRPRKIGPGIKHRRARPLPETAAQEEPPTPTFPAPSLSPKNLYLEKMCVICKVFSAFQKPLATTIRSPFEGQRRFVCWAAPTR